MATYKTRFNNDDFDHRLVVSKDGKDVLFLEFSSQRLMGQCGMSYLHSFMLYGSARDEEWDADLIQAVSNAFAYAADDGDGDDRAGIYIAKYDNDGDAVAKFIATLNCGQRRVAKLLCRAGWVEQGDPVKNPNSGSYVSLFSYDNGLEKTHNSKLSE